MKNLKLTPTVIFSLSLCLAAFILSCAISKIGQPVRTVYVKGLSEIEIPADHVVWPLAHVEMGNSLPQLYSTVERKNKVIIKFLHEGGVSESDISVNNIIVLDRDADTYTADKLPFRYKVTQVIIVSSNNVGTVRKLIDKQTELLKKNIYLNTGRWSYPVNYTFNALEEVKPSMIQQATKNARASAQKFADDSESKIGKIKTASQGQLSISSRDEYTPLIKKLRVVTSVEFFLQD